jgi:hypothetical protein
MTIAPFDRNRGKAGSGGVTVASSTTLSPTGTQGVAERRIPHPTLLRNRGRVGWESPSYT